MSSEFSTDSGPPGKAQPTRARRIDPPDPHEILEDLSHVDLLRALPPEEIQLLLPHVERVEIPRSQRVFSQGETGDALYLIDEGTARVFLDDGTEISNTGPGGVFGEVALLTGEPRNASVEAASDLVLWRIARADFQEIVQESPRLRAAFEEAAVNHAAGMQLANRAPAHRRAWLGVARRAIEARRGGVRPWQIIMATGFALWLALKASEIGRWIPEDEFELLVAAIELIAGLMLIEGASEAFILAIDRSGARLNWDGFTTGTIGSLVSTAPEFVVIAFLVAVQPLAAFVTSAVTVFNNALAFSIYSFFLPKDQKGQYLMPLSLAKAGGEVLVAGSAVALIVGIVMIAARVETGRSALTTVDLIVLSAVFIAIYAYYQYVSVKYYAEGYGADSPHHPPAPGRLGHDTRWRAIALMGLVGVAGSYFGGESVGAFAETALDKLHWPTIPTAAGLAFFAGMAEFVIVWQAHRRGEIGIALSNVFGGITQVQTLLLPFCLGIIAAFALATGDTRIYSLPITLQTTLLMILQFPTLYVLLEYLREDHTLNNLDAASMTGIYGLLLYFLLTA